jgi:nucleoside-diphosphate-sugar epimerase
MSGDPVLITGGAGFIGAAVGRGLLQESVPVVIFDQKAPTPLSSDDPIKAVPVVTGDVLDPFALLRAVKKHNVRRFLHTASIVGAGLSIDNPVRTMEVNMMGLTYLLEAARSLSLGRIVQISSQSVYGPGQYEPVDEKHPTDPDSPYGVTKLAAEKWGNVYASAFGVDFVALRMAHIYGPGRPAGLRGNVIQEMLEAAQAGKAFTMAAGGDQNKEPVYIDDIVSAVLAALDVPSSKLQGRTYNVGVGSVHSWRQIADTIREIYPQAKLELGPGPIVVRGNVLEQRLGPLDYSLATEVLGYTPKYKLREGLQHFAQWLEQTHRGA